MNKLPLLTKDNSPEIIASLLNYLAGRRRFYLPEASESLTGIIKQNHRTVSQSEASVSPYMPLNKDPFFYFSKKRRNRVFSRLKKYGSRLVYNSCKGDLQALETAFALDLKSAKREKGMVTFTDDRDREFFRQLARNFKGLVSIDILFYDGEPIIFSVNFIYNKVYHFFKTAFSGQHNHLLPGKLLLYYVFPRLREEGFEKFDFSRGTSVFKREFTPFSYKQYDLFYARNVFIRWWWGLAASYNRGKRKLFENERFFKLYLWFKRFYAKYRRVPSS